MTSSEGLEARYSAIIDGIASLKDLQPSYPSARVSRITSSSGGVSGRASPAPGTYQRAPSGRPNSRVDSSASSRNSNLSADVAAINSSQRKAVQPSFTSTVRTKTARPESRDRTSAWAAPLYKAPASAEQQQHSQLDTNSWMPHDVLVQSSRVTGQTLADYRSQARPLSRQVTAPQVATIRRDYGHSPSWSSAHKLRPSSAQRQSSAKTSHRSQSRQQDYSPSVPAGGVQFLQCHNYRRDTRCFSRTCS